MVEKHPLEAFRERSQLTQEGLGKLVGVAGATISRWEQRKRMPRGDELKKICAATGIPAAEILGVPEAAE